MLRIRGQRWTVARYVGYPGAAIVEVRGCERGNRGVRARFLLPFEPHDQLPTLQTTRVVTPRRWRQQARQVLAAATSGPDALRCPAAAKIDLLPFQLEPAVALVRGLAARVLIADEVGLGKTVQAGIAIAETIERSPDARVLVITPASLRDQWAGELRDRFALAPAVIDTASLARRGAALHGANPWNATLALTSVDFIKRPEVLRALEGFLWDLVVVDEAHAVCGRSDRNAATRLIAERARTLVLLTATPHSGDDEAFARLCALGDLDRAFPLLIFHRTRADAGVQPDRRFVWLRVAPTAGEAAMHRALDEYAALVSRHAAHSSAAQLAMLVLMRRACSSAGALARSVTRRLMLLRDSPMPPIQLALPLPDPGDDDAEPVDVLAAPGLPDEEEERRRLEQIFQLATAAAADESKVTRLRRLLRRSREPAIVFTEYRDTLEQLRSALDGFRVVQLHGGLGPVERQEVLRQFRAGDADLLLATDAASEGLNLHHRCRLVINLEVPWTPTRLEQRVGRVDRIGQPRRVHQVHLVAAHTAEESLVEAAVRRRGARVREALASMRPSSGGEIATCGVKRPDDTPVPGVSNTFVVDLERDGRDEAQRAALTRTLAGAGATAGATRPFAAAIKRRCSTGLWAVRVTLCDSQHDLLWETVVGLSFHTPANTARRPRDVLRHTAWVGPLNDALRTCEKLLVGRTLLASAPGLELAIRREQAMAAAVERRHARLAAALVQPGLFDRRAEHAAAHQHQILVELLARTELRLDLLRRRRQVVVSAAQPAFAVLR